MAHRVADELVNRLVEAGVKRIYGIVGDSLNPVTDAVLRNGKLQWISAERFIGTALGAAVGAIVASRFGSELLVFAICIFILGPLTAALHSDRSAYRFAGVIVAIVLLVPRTDSALRMALHRFAEVCIGIGMALILTVVWPEPEETTLAKT